jgi:RHS repeat-associated protein
MTRPSGRELSVKSSVKDPLESEVLFSYVGQSVKGFTGSSNQPASISRRVVTKKPDGTVSDAVQSYSFQYNAMGRVTRLVDPVGRTFLNIYASNGIDLLETRQTRAGNNVLLSKTEYDDKHHPISVTDQSGNKTTFKYDERGLLVKRIDSGNNEWETDYDQKGYPITLTGPGNGDSTNVIAKFVYDNVGRIATATDIDGHTIKMAYDNADRLVERTYEDGTTEKISYDKLDAVTFQDRAGHVTKRTYDSQDRMISITDPLGRKSQYEWCLCGALRKLTDPAGHSTEWHHDIEGRIIQKKFANGTETTFEYEKDGHRLLQITDALKQKTVYSYNLDDTLAEVSHENAINPTSATKYQYDPDYTLITSVSSDFGTVNYEYQQVGRPGSGLPRKILNSGIPNSTIGLEYDGAGNLIRRSINGEANVVSSKYDGLGRLSSENTPLGEFRYSYGDHTRKITNRLNKISYPNGVVTTFNYDGASGEERLKSIINSTSEVLSQFDYTYNKSGQIVNWQENFSGKDTAQFVLSYDAAGQLTDAASQIGDTAQSYHYQYDPASNRTQARSGGTLQECAYNSMNELITLATKTRDNQTTNATGTPERFKYDANGNLLSDGDKSYKWDARNRLIRIEYKSGKATEFAYDALGQRSKITELGTDGKPAIQQFLVCLNGTVCEIRNERGEVLKKLFALGENANGKNVYFGRDHLGSTRQTLDSTGSIIARLDYDPFGQPIRSQGEAPNLQYTGYFTHAPSGLNLTLFRAYDSKLGRWLSRDPLGEFGTIGVPDWGIDRDNEIIASNLYAFVNNDTMQLVDPFGLQACSVRDKLLKRLGVDANGKPLTAVGTERGQLNQAGANHYDKAGPGVTYNTNTRAAGQALQTGTSVNSNAGSQGFYVPTQLSPTQTSYTPSLPTHIEGGTNVGYRAESLNYSNVQSGAGAQMNTGQVDQLIRSGGVRVQNVYQ